MYNGSCVAVERSHYINDRRCDVKKALSKEEMEKAKAKGEDCFELPQWRVIGI